MFKGDAAMPFEIDNDFDNIVQIKVIGVGGGGGNAVISAERYAAAPHFCIFSKSLSESWIETEWKSSSLVR